MNEEQYRALCEACDQVLLATDSTIERVAIPWLHVIREHPVFLANYVDLFESAKSGSAVVRKWWRGLRNRAYWLRQIRRSLRSDVQPWYGPEELLRGIDFLFVSHLLNPSQNGQAEDFYFGELPHRLIAMGHNVVIALINHSGQAAPYLADMWKGGSAPRVILSNSLRFWEEFALHRRLKKESLRLRKLAKSESPGLAQRVLLQASEEALSGESISTLMKASQFSALAAKLQPKAIVVTHEGHAYERMAFAATRSVCPNVLCIGYQHAAIFRLQHAIRRDLAREYNPDQILTAGTVGKAQLERALGLNGIPISVLGSNRAAHWHTINGARPMHTRQADFSCNTGCLVLPEGIASECHLLFQFSLVCARAFPEIQFTWRLHPIMTYEFLAAQNPRLRDLPRNIVLSQATLEEDFARCRWALYRGTTAIVQAVVAGLTPIYLQLPDELTIDPLYELKDWRAQVVTISDFRRIIDKDTNTSDSYSRSKMKLATRYCEEFFLPIDSQSMSRIISGLV